MLLPLYDSTIRSTRPEILHLIQIDAVILSQFLFNFLYPIFLELCEVVPAVIVVTTLIALDPCFFLIIGDGKSPFWLQSIGLFWRQRIRINVIVERMPRIFGHLAHGLIDCFLVE